MNHCKKILIIFIAVVVSLTAQASTEVFRCPSKIDTQEKLEKLPAGFESMTMDTNQYWVSVTLYSGHPKENASLAPDNNSWSFSLEDTIYLGCSYNQSKIMLFKQLPKQVTACELIVDKTMQGIAGQGIPEKLLCKIK